MAFALTLSSLCSDEDLAVWDPGDFANLAPRSQIVAAGTDGVFAALTPWVLSSASSAFATAGVAAGSIVALTKPQASFQQGNNLFGVDAATASTVTLRRIGMSAGFGAPPGAGGLTGVEFRVLTFAPQIALSSADVRRQYRLGVTPDRDLAALAESGEELRQLATLTTLRRAYLVAAKGPDGDYKAKLALVSEALSRVEAKLSLTWGASGDAAPPTNLFSMRERR